jgi:hypothetical protein
MEDVVGLELEREQGEAALVVDANGDRTRWEERVLELCRVISELAPVLPP